MPDVLAGFGGGKVPLLLSQARGFPFSGHLHGRCLTTLLGCVRSKTWSCSRRAASLREDSGPCRWEWVREAGRVLWDSGTFSRNTRCLSSFKELFMRFSEIVTTTLPQVGEHAYAWVFLSIEAPVHVGFPQNELETLVDVTYPPPRAAPVSPFREANGQLHR